MSTGHQLAVSSKRVAQQGSGSPFYVEAHCNCGQFCLIGSHRLAVVESAFDMHLKVMATERMRERMRT